MDIQNVRNIKKSLQKHLKPTRYEHTMGVMYTAAALAMSRGLDPDQALLAGLLHDCGKYGTEEEQLQSCRKNGIVLTEYELKSPALVHAKLGTYYAQHRYGVTDQEILNAIRYHTTGRPDMSELEKIIYLADYIEPGRKEIPNLKQIRQLAFQDLDGAVAKVAGQTLSYLEQQGGCIDPATKETGAYYKRRSL